MKFMYFTLLSWNAKFLVYSVFPGFAYGSDVNFLPFCPHTWDEMKMFT